MKLRFVKEDGGLWIAYEDSKSFTGQRGAIHGNDYDGPCTEFIALEYWHGSDPGRVIRVCKTFLQAMNAVREWNKLGCPQTMLGGLPDWANPNREKLIDDGRTVWRDVFALLNDLTRGKRVTPKRAMDLAGRLVAEKLYPGAGGQS